MAIKRIRESEEMYLETILLLRGKKAEVHSIDVAEELGYVKSSVSRGVNLLKARISLCKKGELRKSAVSFFKIFFIGIKKS